MKLWMVANSRVVKVFLEGFFANFVDLSKPERLF